MSEFAKQVQLRRGTYSEIEAFTGAEGEIVYDKTNKTVVVEDGETEGGFHLVREVDLDERIQADFKNYRSKEESIEFSDLSIDVQTNITNRAYQSALDDALTTINDISETLNPLRDGDNGSIVISQDDLSSDLVDLINSKLDESSYDETKFIKNEAGQVELENLSDSLQSILSKLQSDITNLGSVDLNDLQTQLSTLQTQVNNLQIDVLSDTLNNLVSEVSSLTSKEASDYNSLDTRITANENTLEEHTKSIENLTLMGGGGGDVSSAQLDEVKNEISDLTDQLNSVKTNVTSISNDTVNNSDKIKDLTTNLTNVVSGDDSTSGSIRYITKNYITSSYGDLQSLSNQTSSNTNLITEIDNRLNTIESNYSTVETSFNTFNDRLNKYTSITTSLSDIINGSDGYIGLYEDFINSMDKVNSSISELKDTDNNTTSKLDELTSRIQIDETDLQTNYVSLSTFNEFKNSGDFAQFMGDTNDSINEMKTEINGNTETNTLQDNKLTDLYKVINILYSRLDSNTTYETDKDGKTRECEWTYSFGINSSSTEYTEVNNLNNFSSLIYSLDFEEGIDSSLQAFAIKYDESSDSENVTYIPNYDYDTDLAADSVLGKIKIALDTKNTQSYGSTKIIISFKDSNFNESCDEITIKLVKFYY